jgi:hypothetical protein
METASNQAYNASLISWFNGTAMNCRMPCQTTSLRLKIVFKETPVGLRSCSW